MIFAASALDLFYKRCIMLPMVLAKIKTAKFGASRFSGIGGILCQYHAVDPGLFLL